MKTYKNLYQKIATRKNIYEAYRNARKGKTKKIYVKAFEKNLISNIDQLRIELLLHTYQPRPLETFTVRDPKTRKISKSDFKDRVVHHALCNVIEPLFDKSFIYDSYANRKGKGTLAALRRLDVFKRKVSRNGKDKGWINNNQVKGYCLKADIRHYFEEVDHRILMDIIKKKIRCPKTVWLIRKILANYGKDHQKSMPLGNLTSQIFANIYLDQLDKFIKHKLKVRYYLRYVDDFVILHASKGQLIRWKNKVDKFLKRILRLQLHHGKSRIMPLSKPILFVGFRVFYHYRLLKRCNRKSIQKRVNRFYQLFLQRKICYDKVYESTQGSFAYMKHANTYYLRMRLAKQVERMFPNQISSIEIKRHMG